MPYKDIEKRRLCQRRHKRSRSLYQAAWRKKNPEKFKEYARRWYSKNRTRVNEYRKEYIQRRYVASPWLRTYDGILTRLRQARRGKHRQLCYVGIKMFMTREDLKFLWFRDNAAAMNSPSIDRKDGKGDYTLANCRYLEMKENRRLVKRVYSDCFPFKCAETQSVGV